MWQEMDTWQTTGSRNLQKKKSVFKSWNRTENESHRKPQKIFREQPGWKKPSEPCFLQTLQFDVVRWSWAKTLCWVSWWRSQCGVAFLLSSRVCRPSCRPRACCVPTLWAVSVAVMSIWAYLVELFPVKTQKQTLTQLGVSHRKFSSPLSFSFGLLGQS